jgi:N-acetylglucosaminyl-diphospho-decaprenol L-rhamnosyltransferase
MNLNLDRPIIISDKKLWSRYMWLHLKSMVRYSRKYLLPPIPGLSIRTESYPVWQKEHIA